MNNLMNCPDCGKEISLRALACPNCGAPGTTPVPPVLKSSFDSARVLSNAQPIPAKPKPKQYSLSHLLLIILMCVPFIWFMTKRDIKSGETKALQPSEIEWMEEGGLRYVVGSVYNSSDKTYSYVQVQINLYDKQRTLVGGVWANINNLEPKSIWKYKGIVAEQDAETASLKDLTGF